MALAVPSRRRAIEDVASALFRRQGYAGTSVRDIARALDMQGASLYAHVASKEEVLWSIVDRAAHRFESAAEAADAGLPASAGVVDRIAALVRAHTEVIAGDPELASVFVHEWRHLRGARREEILARRDAYEHRLRTLIADGMASGELLPTDPATAATFILTALNGLATWYDPRGRLSPDRLADHYAGFAVRALTEDRR
ncbi:MAG TPA: TetR/AcrR family transcriptional regulator [Vitreimonas sp.]|nr:TetR/AcrR family transcriptional regulator [Vitreimonas sp.]